MVSLKSIAITLPLCLASADPIATTQGTSLSCLQCIDKSGTNTSDCYTNTGLKQASTDNSFCQTTVVFREFQSSAKDYVLKNDGLLEVSRSPSLPQATKVGTTCDIQYETADKTSYLVKCTTVCQGNNCNSLADPVNSMITELQSAKCYQFNCAVDTDLGITCTDKFPLSSDTSTISSKNGFCYVLTKPSTNYYTGAPNDNYVPWENYHTLETLNVNDFTVSSSGASYQSKFCVGHLCNQMLFNPTTNCTQCQSSEGDYGFDDCLTPKASSQNYGVCDTTQTQCVTEMTFSAGSSNPNGIKRSCLSQSKASLSDSSSCQATAVNYDVDSFCSETCVASAEACNTNLVANTRTTTTTTMPTTKTEQTTQTDSVVVTTDTSGNVTNEATTQEAVTTAGAPIPQIVTLVLFLGLFIN